MRKNEVQTRCETGRLSKSIKPALLTLAITQALAFQAAQAANIEVTSNLDDGTDCTLREALATINAGVDQNNGCIINGALNTDDAISFAAGVAGSTIVTNSELAINRVVSINSGGVSTTIDANGVGFVIGVGGAGARAELDQLTLTGGSYGGISASNYASISLRNSTVTGNYGSGISASNSGVGLSNSTVSGNSTGGSGGGINAGSRSSVRLTNSTVSGNTANYGGGGIFVRNYTPVFLNDSTVSGNNAGRDGGGIYSNGLSFVRLTNSTVSGNSAGRDGGGIHAFVDNSIELTNSTVSGNSAEGKGGGIYTADSYLRMSNSIVANSSGADCATPNNSATATADSIIEDGSCGTAALAVDPVLGPLADNGGPTQTHALLAGSPAIDNGTGAGATATDQRGVDAQGVRDSGAYEFTAAVNALMIEKLINSRARETADQAAQLLVGTRYRAEYKVTNNSPNRIYGVQVFESAKLICNLYALDPGESKRSRRCARNVAVLSGIKNVPATVTANVSGSSETLVGQTNAYYNGLDNVQGELKVTHYIDEKNADTQNAAVEVNSNEAIVKFRVENTGPIEIYRVKLYHDPASPVNSGWQELCFKGTLEPGEVRYCKRPISVTEGGLNKAFGRAQGRNANVSGTGFVNASNPTYFNVVLP